jgi:hypothetical protein
MEINPILTTENRSTTANTRLAQWGLASFIGSLCLYCKFVLVDSLVFQIPPLRQAWERWWLFNNKANLKIWVDKSFGDQFQNFYNNFQQRLNSN